MIQTYEPTLDDEIPFPNLHALVEDEEAEEWWWTMTLEEVHEMLTALLTEDAWDDYLEEHADEIEEFYRRHQ